MKRPILTVLFIIYSISSFSQTILLELSGIRNTNGVIRLAFFVDQTSFRSETPMQTRVFEKSGMLHGALRLQVDSIPPGRYGIAVLDDENRNGRLDYRLFLPSEGVGFSQYEQHGLHRPVFEDFCFFLPKNVTLRIPIRLTYY